MRAWHGSLRLAGLLRFAAAITVLTVLGHVHLGFEASWMYPAVALLVAYAVELLLEVVKAWAERRPPRFAGGATSLVLFLLPAHITGLAVAMLLYANQELAPVAFAAGLAVASKVLLTARVDGQPRHFLNPSNFGISATLLLFPRVGIAPPYQFTANLDGVGDWLLPLVIVGSGSFLNARYTRRLPLIAGWLVGFVAQALVRSEWQGTPVAATLAPMTGVAFVLYTFYMVTDPGTTPQRPRAQVLFGVSVAVVYGALLRAHVVFDLFFALTIVCSLRGAALNLRARAPMSRSESATP